VDRVNGVNAAELAAKVQRHAGVSMLPTADEPTAEKVRCVVCCTVILISYCLYAAEMLSMSVCCLGV